MEILKRGIEIAKSKGTSFVLVVLSVLGLISFWEQSLVIPVGNSAVEISSGGGRVGITQIEKDSLLSISVGFTPTFDQNLLDFGLTVMRTGRDQLGNLIMDGTNVTVRHGVVPGSSLVIEPGRAPVLP